MSKTKDKVYTMTTHVDKEKVIEEASKSLSGEETEEVKLEVLKKVIKKHARHVLKEVESGKGEE